MNKFVAWLPLFVVLFGVYLYVFDGKDEITFQSAYTSDISGTKKSTFRPGETVYVHREFCIHRETEGRTVRTLTNKETGSVTFFGTNMYDGRVGCRRGAFGAVLESSTPKGNYSIQSTFSLDVNPIRTRSFSTSSLSIKIE